MTARELAENMGNIDQRLIESAGAGPQLRAAEENGAASAGPWPWRRRLC